MIQRMVFLLLLLLSVATAQAAKPDSPLSVEIIPAGSVKAGKEAAFKVTVISQVPAEELVIHIHPIGDVKWSKGEKRWSGAVHRGTPSILEFSVVVPKQGDFELHAVVSVQGKAGGGFGARAVYCYEDPAVKKPEPKERKTLRNGQEITEVPLR